MGEASLQTATTDAGTGPCRVPDVEAEFVELRRTDPWGNVVHGAVAALTCFLIVGPVTVSQVSLFPLLLCFVIRVTGMHPIMHRLGQTPVGKLLMAWPAWCLLSILWSVDRSHFVDEMSDLRWVLLPPLLWAALDRRTWFVGAMATGLMMGVAYVGLRAVWPEATGGTPRWGEDRYSGWWHPVVGGSVLTAALGLHLPAAMLGRGRAQVVGVLCAGATAAAVLATGSRGAWLASAALVLLAAAWGVFGGGARRGSERESRARWRGPILMAGAAAVLGAAVWIGYGDAVERRFVRGVQEVRGALIDKDFTSDTGARLLLAWWAMEAIAERPVWGTGMGGYRAWVIGHLESQGIDPATRKLHGHAHNSVLHIGATLGLVGVGIAAAIISLTLRSELRRARALRQRMRAVAAGEPGKRLGVWAVYDMGPLWALAGLTLVSLFDTVQVNAQTAALLWLLIGLCPMRRPEPVGLSRPGGVVGAG